MKAILGASFAEREATKSWPILLGLMGLTLDTGKVCATSEAATAFVTCRITFYNRTLSGLLNLADWVDLRVVGANRAECLLWWGSF
jgi:hypothetical protein